MVRQYVTVMLTIAAAFSLDSRSGVAEDSGAEGVVEQLMSSGVVGSRRQIEHGFVELEWTIERFNVPDYPWLSKRSYMRCWFADGHRRFDMRGVSVAKDGREATSESQVIFDAKGGFMFRPDLDKHAVEISSAESGNFSYVEDYDWDVRCLGLAPVSFQRLTEYGLNDVFQMLTQGDVAAHTTADGILKLSSSFESPGQKEVNSLWQIDPAQGGAVIHASVERPDSSHTLEVRNTEWHPGVWFPSSIRFQHKIESQLVYEESVIVSDVDFLSNIDSSVFSLSGLEMSPGRSVRDHGEYRKWDGAKLVEHPEFTDRPPAVDIPVPASRFPLWLGANILIAVGVACFFSIRYLRTRWRRE